MDPGSAPSFRTKTGTCVIHADRLVLERSGPRGALANALFGHSVLRGQIFYGVMVVLLAMLAVLDAIQGDAAQAGLFLVLAVFLVRGILKSRGLSATPVIVRAAITRIEARPPMAPVTRGHFIVHFTENGRALRRLLILPGVLDGGAAEYARAIDLLRQEGLPFAEPPGETHR